MPYVKRVWKDRSVEKPRTYNITNNADGTITLTPAPGTITEAGTNLTAAVMNNIENYIELLDKTVPKVSAAEPTNYTSNSLWYQKV